MNNRNGNKIWAVCLILLMLMSAFVMIANAAETEPNNGKVAANQMVTAVACTGAVDGTATDPFDYWNITLTGGAAAHSQMKLDVTVAGWAGPGFINITMPDDQGHNFLIGKFQVQSNMAFVAFMNATVSGNCYMIIGGPSAKFTYSVTPTVTTETANTDFDNNDTFATAYVLPKPTATVNNALVIEKDFVDIVKFTTTTSEIVNITITTADVGEFSYFLFDNSYAAISFPWYTDNTATKAYINTTGHAGTYYLAICCPIKTLGVGGTYTLTSSIVSPPVNKIPALSAKSITPSTIKNTQDNNVLFSINAVDSDGTVANVTVACSALWTGEWRMIKGASNTWSVTKKILMANISVSDLGNQSVTFKAIDDDVEYNTTTMNLTVIQGNTAPTSDYNLTTPYAISVPEDSGIYSKNLTALVDDDGDAINLTFEVGTGTTFSGTYNGKNISVEIVNNTWMNVTLEPNGYGVETFTVSAYDDEFTIYFNVTFTITSVNDKPVWGHIEKVVPAGTDLSIVWGENTTLDVDEDTVYNFTLVATDVDGDNMTYDSNITGKDNFAVDENGNVTFTPSQADIGTGVENALWYVEFEVYDASSTLTPANKTTVIFNISNVNDVPEKAVIAYAITDADAKQAGNNNLTVKFTITAPADEDGDTNFTYKFYWNNGTTADTTETHIGDFTIEHTYAAAGLYIVKVVVDDQNGGTNTSYSTEINVSAPNLKPVPEQWIMGWKTADKTGDSAVEITFGVCTVTVKTEKDKPAAGKSTSTTTYTFSGTCGTDVTLIYLYFASQKNTDEYTYYAFNDPNAPTDKLEIVPESGAWSESIVYTYTYDTPAPTTGTPSTDVYTAWYAAVGWTADGTFNWAEKKVAAAAVPDDDDTDDDSSMMMYGIIGGAVFLVIIIIVVIVVIMMMKKKKAAAAQAPPAPAPGTEGQPAPGAGPVGPEAQAPVMCQCGNQIPAGSLNCPVCGAPAPAPAPAAAPQVDQYGQPIQQQQPPMDQQPQMQQAPPQGYPPQQAPPQQGYPPQQQAQPGYPQQQQPGYPPQQ